MLDRLRHFTNRTDARAALFIGAVLLTGNAIESGVLYAFVEIEALEQGDAWVRHTLRTVSREITANVDPSVALADIELSLEGARTAARVATPDGNLESWGTWPDPAATSPALSGADDRNLTAFRLLRPEGYLVGGRSLDRGGTLDVAVSMKHFAAEASEVGEGLLLVAVASSALALLSAAVATLWAFRPLRDATKTLERVGSQRIRERLATRGTTDPIDRHSQILNDIFAEIETSFSRLRAFSSDVAHEFRTPLNRIATVADVGRDGTPDEARIALTSVLATTEDLTRLVDALMLIAEVEDGRGSIGFERIDVGDRLSKVVALYEPAFSERGSLIRVNVSPISVHGVPQLFDRVLVNLLENALQHTDPGTEVEVSCCSSDQAATITVEDSGSGIPHQYLDAVFDRFVRIRGDRKEGHGLGLALARSIALFHRGHLRAEASEMGGARFVWWIPTTGA